MNYVTDLSVSPLTQGGKEVVMTYIAQQSLIPTFNWLLIVEKEYSEYEMDTQLKALCHYQVRSIISLSLVSEFYYKGTWNYPNHCQGIDDNADVFAPKHCLPTP